MKRKWVKFHYDQFEKDLQFIDDHDDGIKTILDNYLHHEDRTPALIFEKNPSYQYTGVMVWTSPAITSWDTTNDEPYSYAFAFRKELMCADSEFIDKIVNHP